MKIPLLAFAVLLPGIAVISPLFAADDLSSVSAATAPATKSTPVLHGVLSTSAGKQFQVSDEGGRHGEWLALGDSFQDWKLASYRDKDGALVLRKADGTEMELTMGSGHTGQEDVKATLVDAQNLLKKMHFSEMFTKVVAQQRQASLGMIRQMMGRTNLPPNTSQEDMMAFQQKLQDKMWSGVDADTLQQGVAQIYSDVFTADQLNGMADFYDTPAGQAVLQKQPEIQQKTMALLMPMIAQNMPAVQQMAKDFAAQHKQAPAPANSEAPAAAAPTP